MNVVKREKLNIVMISINLLSFVGQIKLGTLAEEANIEDWPPQEFIVKIGHIFNSVSCFDSVFIQHKLHVVIYSAFLHHKLLPFEPAFCPFFTYDRRIKPVDTIIPSDL